MASPGINVLRWSALAFGVAYGVTHQRSITVAQRAQHEKHQYDEQQKKIDRAKAEYAKQKAPPAAASSSGVITDPSNPNFDLEKLLLSQDKA